MAVSCQNCTNSGSPVPPVVASGTAWAGLVGSLRIACLAVVLLGVAADGVEAQRAAPVAVRRAEVFARRPAPAPSSPAADTPAPEHGRFWARVGAGTLGLVGGAAVGAIVGSAIYGQPGRRACSFDCGARENDPTGFIRGAIIGSVAGTAAMAAIPSAPPCDYGRRFGLGLIGGTAGAAVGLAAGRTMKTREEDSMIPPFAVGTLLGAAMLSDLCR